MARLAATAMHVPKPIPVSRVLAPEGIPLRVPLSMCATLRAPVTPARAYVQTRMPRTVQPVAMAIPVHKRTPVRRGLA